MLALIPGFFTVVLLGFTADDAGAVASREYTQQPLKDRCAVARIVAAEVLDQLAFTRWDFPRDNQLRLFISKQKVWDAKRELSIFGKRESCGEIDVGSRYTGERRIKVTLGRGKRDDLPSNQFFHLVRVQSSTARRWEITWKTSDFTWTCPKPWEHQPGKVQICVGRAHSMVPMPTVRLVLAKGTTGGFEVASSRLQFSGSPKHKPSTDKSEALSDLPLESRCEIAEKIATGLAMSFAYSRWFGLVDRNITLAIPVPGKSDSGEPQAAIFRPGERCDNIFANHWYMSGSIRIKLAHTVMATSPPSRDFFSLRSRELSPNRWQFSWTFDRSFWTCPKPDDDHYLGQCPDPTDPTIPMPTLRIEVVRESPDGIALVSSALEFKTDNGGTQGPQ